MFGFKKKKEAPKPQTETPSQEITSEQKAFAAQFLPEETDLLVVTSPAGMGREELGETGLWKIAISISAWVDEYTHELTQGKGTLEAIVDDKLLNYMIERIPRNFILSVTVRPSESGVRFLMTDLPKPGFDADLKAILDEQKAPVTLEVEGLGTFSLNRALNWFEASVDWMDGQVSLTFDQAEETMQAAQDTARALVEHQEEWDVRLRAYLAEQCLDEVNQLLLEYSSDQDEEEEPFTPESLSACLELDSILVGPEGAFEFWFGGDDLFVEHTIHVTGNLEQGPVQAELEG